MDPVRLEDPLRQEDAAQQRVQVLEVLVGQQTHHRRQRDDEEKGERVLDEWELHAERVGERLDGGIEGREADDAGARPDPSVRLKHGKELAETSEKQLHQLDNAMLVLLVPELVGGWMVYC